MNIGVIDIGSNSTKCVVYEIVDGEIKSTYSQTHYNRVGEEVANSGQIKQAKIIELIDILMKFKSDMDKMNVDDIVCFGTWALRVAKNSEIVVKNVKEKTGVVITILDEYKESLYSFHSLSFLKSLHGKKASLNVGGGSIELAVGDIDLEGTYTMDLGGVVLKEKFFSEDVVPNFAKIKRTTDYVWDVFKKHDIENKFNNDVAIVGIGGTFSSLFDALFKMKVGVEKLEDKLIRLPEESFSIFFSKVRNMKEKEIQNRFGIHEKRADIFLPSLVVVKSLLDVLKLPAIYVSTLSIREGYIYYNYLMKNSK